MGALAKQLGKDIRRCRKASKITLEKLELVTGITRKTLIRLEKGEDVRNQETLQRFNHISQLELKSFPEAKYSID